VKPALTQNGVFLVLIYARYSTDKQDPCSIEDQIRICRARAEEGDWVVSEVIRDEAQSGASMHRVGLQRILALARTKGGSPFKAVVVHDLSRLSRDLGHAFRIVFEELAVLGVSVVDVRARMSSDQPGARLTFGAMALVNDQFLQMVKDSTHRGLEGRSLEGFWTGGKVYGFRTERETSPRSADHPRAVPVVHREEAGVVERIFRAYDTGQGFKQIAMRLNADHVAPPHAGSRWKDGPRGWSPSTIRMILMNERYIGRFFWNRSVWGKVDGKRRRRARPLSDLRGKEIPELAIVPEGLWDAVQARLAARREQYKVGGRPHGTGKSPRLFAGLLRCASCGASLAVTSTKRLAGRTPVGVYGCNAHYRKGGAICTNNLTVTEPVVVNGILDCLGGVLMGPGVVARFVETYRREFEAAEAGVASADSGDAALAKEIGDGERRLRNVTEALAATSGGGIEAHRSSPAEGWFGSAAPVCRCPPNRGSDRGLSWRPVRNPAVRSGRRQGSARPAYRAYRDDASTRWRGPPLRGVRVLRHVHRPHGRALRPV